MADQVRFDVRYTGRVQGVFFRATAQRIARDFAVAGWVRNEPDGSVRLLAEGSADELDRFLAAVQAAKAPNIDDTALERSAATGEFDGFYVAG